jgi:aspartyl-tRNA(Asn)/glutamyl-tRNA(Gln) amidotransferase subunit B
LRRENKTIMANTAYETIIGLEVHVQLATESKAFCGDDASFGGEPNTHVSAVSLGHPGTLPKANGRQIELATRLGLALGCKINTHNAFDRKNYFYADLPKGYQITQDKAPICIGGSLSIKIGNNWKSIGIHHIHMEEDAGKSIHTMAPRHSFIDLNRAGVPLVEIVTEPDLRSGEEVDAFMTAMRQLVRYLEVSDGNMEQGSLRCDVNISIREQGATILNDRCEVKNVNSMKFARQAIDYEVRRQIGLVEAGGKVKQQTLNFDPNTGVTSPLREKEDAHDYRYFPEPDLPPVVLSDA